MPTQHACARRPCRRLVGGTEPGAALAEEGMGTSYQAFCITQRGLVPWPFGAQPAETEEEVDAEGEGEGAAGAGGVAAPGQQRSEQPPAPQQ